MSEALRIRLRAAADSIAQAVEEELRQHTGGSRLLTLEDVAERLGRHPQTVRRRARLGQLDVPVVEEDGDPRVRQEDLDVYIRSLAERRRLRQIVETEEIPEADSFTGMRRSKRGLRRFVA